MTSYLKTESIVFDNMIREETYYQTEVDDSWRETLLLMDLTFNNIMGRLRKKFRKTLRNALTDQALYYRVDLYLVRNTTYLYKYLEIKDNLDRKMKSSKSG
jgi:hypothetical protein